MKAGTELEQMLEGKKAMAAFCRHSSEDFDETGGQNFEPHVQSGLLEKKRFFVKNHGGINIVYTVYFRTGQGWRYDLYKKLKKSVSSGWTIDKEIIESILLDYDRNEIKDYIRRLSE